MRRTKRPLLGFVGALILTGVLAGTVYDATVTASGTDSVSGYSLYSAMSVTDLSAGSYRGETYAEVLGVNVDTLHNWIEMQEICNGGVSTDYSNPSTNYNVSWSDQLSPTVGYATGFFDCPLSQGIRNYGWARWIDSSPAVDFQRLRIPCMNVRAGGAC